MIIWLTGQPGSGKTTLARALKERGIVDFVVDGDELRALRTEWYDYYGRHRNVERAQDIALWLDVMGQNVAVAVIAPHRKQRLDLVSKVEAYHVVYLYGREHEDITRHVVDYERPDMDEALYLHTTLSVDTCVEMIVGYLGE